MREDIELATHKLYFSRHDRVVTDANHENMSFYSLGGGLAFTFRDFSSWPCAATVCGKMPSFFYVNHRLVTF